MLGSIAAGLGLGGGNVLNSVGDGLGNMFNEISGGAAKDRALGAQAAGTQAGISTMLPWEVQGRNAMNSLANNDFMQNWQTDPGYQFQLQEGMKGVNNAMAARGLGNSGAALKEMARYTTGLANQSYQQGYQNNLSRLGLLSGQGSNAAANIAGMQTGLGNANAAANIGQYNTIAGLAGQGAQAAGMAAMFSDKRLKTNIEPVSKEDIAELKSQLRAFYFDYKDKIHGAGRWVGIMAQDLEKSKLGKWIVVENRKGEKMIDMHKVGSLFLATMAEVT